MPRSVAPRATFTEELDRAGIRKSELARIAGVHEQTIHAAINPSTDESRTGRVSMRTAHRLARAFAQLHGDITAAQALTMLFATDEVRNTLPLSTPLSNPPPETPASVDTP